MANVYFQLLIKLPGWNRKTASAQSFFLSWSLKPRSCDFSGRLTDFVTTGTLLDESWRNKPGSNDCRLELTSEY